MVQTCVMSTNQNFITVYYQVKMAVSLRYMSLLVTDEHVYTDYYITVY